MSNKKFTGMQRNSLAHLQGGKKKPKTPPEEVQKLDSLDKDVESTALNMLKELK